MPIVGNQAEGGNIDTARWGHGVGNAIVSGENLRLKKRKSHKGTEIVKKRHQDWYENQILWRRLLDSLEGGERYRQATYGPDRRGLPTRNLFRHRREYPDAQEYPTAGNTQGYAGYAGMDGVPANYTGFGPYPGSVGADPGATAQDDDYELRRSRTPVPNFVTEAIEVHLSKVYDQEIARDGPDEIMEWWSNADGRGTPMDDWMRETVAPLLLVLGCLDVYIDHPHVPGGEEVVTRADERRLGLDRVVASYILPVNMVWWEINQAGRYEQCLVREYVDPSHRQDFDVYGKPIDTDEANKSEESQNWRKNYMRWRHWTKEGWTLYNADGSEVIDEGEYPYGMVPILRLIDKVRHRTPNVGKSRYEATAMLQREYYNVRSELTLSNTLQAHPSLSGPMEMIKGDNTVSVGPGFILPDYHDPGTGSWRGWSYVSPPKDPAESLRVTMREIRDEVDRENHLIKPAGTVGTAATTVSQSGLSKEMDAVSGNRTLNSLAKSLARAERFMAEYVAMVVNNAVPDEAYRKQIRITYPTRFELHSAAEMGSYLQMLQGLLAQAGQAPVTELFSLRSLVRVMFLGLGDETYNLIDQELQRVIETKAQIQSAMQESLGTIGVTSKAEAIEGLGGGPSTRDSTGISGGTMVSGITPSVLS